MTEVLIVIGMILAFLAGAYIRKPFEITREKQIEIPQTETVKEKKLEQINNLLSYNGTKQGDDE